MFHIQSLGFQEKSECMLMMPLASGKYIALCEGDDYWSGSHKLQKQFDFMESHPECSLVCHNTMVHYMNGMKPDALMNSWSDIHRLSEDDIFICWDVHTSSYFLRREYFGRKDYQRKFSRILPQSKAEIWKRCAAQPKNKTTQREAT